ncbi:amphiphysin isoform X2 [Trematomus bernacchii]|uniref:amphiphysin isoform X2 n=1 Tax=Trematomus bernacchii TaxID=40690 RepID=UPI00146B43CC|nr:amphiphysin isoform X2 [Trematomus bernacchii]
MAEIKTGIFAKNVQKRLNRAQEKVLQKLGKADETKDEQFEQVVVNFRRQESEGSRLQREMKAYMAAIKGMQQASINLTQSLHEVYEPDWHGKDDVMVIGKDCDAMWEDFHNKLVDSTLLNLDEYLVQFPDLRTRVAKRSRKLIDYDSARHHVETLALSGMKSDRKMIKADDELKKAQKVFDELDVGLQDELPSLWDSRVGFYISTFKSVTNLEAKFHREISLVCRQLYEVMTQLAEQHSDKMFTIQGAPSDSGPLRLARTPSPPEDESPPESPDVSSNHMLRPVSPGPPRPKSPIQGPPVPPQPKATPTKEVAEEQIIDLFGGEFLPAPTPSQPNERPGESLLDLDFDAFEPDESVSPIPQTAVPWDMWSGEAQKAESGADTGFVADWSADFGSANGDAAQGPKAPDVGPEGGLDTATPPQDGGAATATPPQDGGAATAGDENATAPSFFAEFDKMNEVTAESAEGPEATGTEPAQEQDKYPAPPATAAPPAGEKVEEPAAPPAGEKVEEPAAPSAGEKVEEPAAPPAGEKVEEPAAPPAGEKVEEPAAPPAGERVEEPAAPPAGKKVEEPASPPAGEKVEEPASPPAGEKVEEPASPPAGEKVEEPAAPPAGEKVEEPAAPPAGERVEEPAAPSAGEKVEEPASPPAGEEVEEPAAPPADGEDKADRFGSPKEEKPDSTAGSPSSEKAALEEIAPAEEVKTPTSEKMPIPSVVIEPASSNEGDDDRDADIISPTAIGDSDMTAETQTIKHMSPSGGVSGLPDDFLYKVETMHDFEAANSDELELKRGDVALVVPTASVEDQDAGWLTGIRESDWLTLGASAHKGLFPENFIQRLE